jgi:hypothetical protein
MIKALYWALSLGALGLMLADGPHGKLLVTPPERVDPGRARPEPSARGGGPPQLWLGGGYHGGK